MYGFEVPRTCLILSFKSKKYQILKSQTVVRNALTYRKLF